MRKISLFVSLCLAILTFAIVLVPIGAIAEYPTKPVVSIVPFSAGGGTDMVGRTLASVIHKYLGQPFVVVNKPGVSGTVGAAYVVKSKPDGYTLGYFGSMAATPEVFTKYFKTDYISEDLIPVAQWTGYPPVYIASAKKPFKTLKEFFDYARKTDEVLFATRGVGQTTALALQLVLDEEKVTNVKAVPFKGDSKIIAAILGGHADIGCVTFNVAAPLIKAGKITGLSLATDNTIEEFPDIPNLFSLGYNTGIRQLYLGAFVPKGTPPEIVAKLEKAIESATQDKSFKSMMKKMNMPIIYKSGEELGKLRQEIKQTYRDLQKKGMF